MSTSPTSGTTSNVRQATSREFLSIIFRRKWLILGLFFVTTATVLGIAFTTPVVYQSSGRVLLKRGEQASALSPNRQLFNDWEEDLGSEVEVARSQPVLTRVREILKDSTAAGAPSIGFDPGRVDVEVMGKSNVLGLGYSDLDPSVAHRVCEALLSAYVEFRQNRMSLEKPERFFDRELASVDSTINAKLSLRELLAQQSGLVDLEAQPREWMSQIGVLESRRSETTAELAEAEAAQRAMERLRRNPDVDLPTLGAAYTNESALVELKRKLVDQEARIAQMRERYRDDSPEVINARETMETLRGMLTREVEARVTMSASRIEMLRARLEVLDRDLAGLRVQMGEVPGKRRTIDELDADIKTLRVRYGELAKAADQAKMTANTSQGVSVVLLDPAGAPRPLNTRDYVRLALAPAFSLVVGIGLAFFIDGLDLTVRTAGQAEEYLEVPVLASLSERRNKRG